MAAKKSRKWLMLIYPETGLLYTDIIDKLTEIGMPGFVSPLHTPEHEEYSGDSLIDSIGLLHSLRPVNLADMSPKPHLHVYLEYSGPTTEAHIHALVATALGLPLDAIPLMIPCANELATWDYFSHSHQPEKQQFTYGNTVFGGYKPPQTDATVTQTVRTVIRVINRERLASLSALLMCDAPEMTPDVVAWICGHAYLCDRLIPKAIFYNTKEPNK